MVGDANEAEFGWNLVKMFEASYFQLEITQVFRRVQGM